MESCQEAVSSREFSEWIAYDSLEPIGLEPLKVYLGTIAATIANVARTKKTKALQWNDMLFDWQKGAKDVQSPQEQLSIAETLNAMFGGIDLRKKPPTS